MQLCHLRYLGADPGWDPVTSIMSFPGLQQVMHQPFLTLIKPVKYRILCKGVNPNGGGRIKGKAKREGGTWIGCWPVATDLSDGRLLSWDTLPFYVCGKWTAARGYFSTFCLLDPSALFPFLKFRKSEKVHWVLSCSNSPTTHWSGLYFWGNMYRLWLHFLKPQQLWKQSAFVLNPHVRIISPFPSCVLVIRRRKKSQHRCMCVYSASQQWCTEALPCCPAFEMWHLFYIAIEINPTCALQICMRMDCQYCTVIGSSICHLCSHRGGHCQTAHLLNDDVHTSITQNLNFMEIGNGCQHKRNASWQHWVPCKGMKKGIVCQGLFPRVTCFF